MRKIQLQLLLLIEKIQTFALGKGLIVQRIIDPKKILELINKLRPIKSGHHLIRIGGENDGGYLIPADLEGIELCFSPGVSNSARFEEELKSRFKIESHLADFSVNTPPNGFKPKSFSPIYIGAYSGNHYSSYDDWIDDKIPAEYSKDLIMQIDIEGDEYSAILGLSRRNLIRFRIIVIEIHNIEKWAEKAFYSFAASFVEKLIRDFSVVHFHPNNFSNIKTIGGVEFPGVFELTLLRKDRIRAELGYARIPHPSDQKNSEQRAELTYSFFE